MKMDDNVDCQLDTGDTTWVLLSTLLVLTMMPALGFFEAGMLRSKNTLSIISQIFTGIIIMSTMWVLFGYTLVFGPSAGGIIGKLDHLALYEVSYFKCSAHARTIPAMCYALFQLMFASITPLLMTGAFAERMRWKAFFWLIILWEFFIYYPLAHWIWGGGWLDKMGVLDFAGGIVIHTSAGIGSIVCALYLGRRKGYNKYMGEFPPSNLPLAAIGAGLLWMGWFGFNGGSALQAGPIAVVAIMSSQLGGSASALVWLCLSWWHGTPAATALMNGVLAGLAGITPAAGYIDAHTAMVLGVVLGLASFYGVHFMKHTLRIDDALDVSSVHGLTGVIGSLAVGLASQSSFHPDADNGWFYGNPKLFLVQLLAVGVTLVYAGIMTFAILYVLDKALGGIRVLEEEEDMGVDWVEHREVAYHDLHVLGDEVVHTAMMAHHQLDEQGRPITSYVPVDISTDAQGFPIAVSSSPALSSQAYPLINDKFSLDSSASGSAFVSAPATSFSPVPSHSPVIFGVNSSADGGYNPPVIIRSSSPGPNSNPRPVTPSRPASPSLTPGSPSRRPVPRMPTRSSYRMVEGHLLDSDDDD